MPPSRIEMLLVAVCAALVAAMLFIVADRTDSHALESGLGFLGAASAWVFLGALMGAIFGRGGSGFGGANGSIIR